MSLDEFIKGLSDSLKLALHELKIKPRIITEIRERTIFVHDTTIKEVPVTILSKDKWNDLVSDQRSEDNVAKVFGLSKRELTEFKGKLDLQ